MLQDISLQHDAFVMIVTIVSGLAMESGKLPRKYARRINGLEGI
jgi:hypothetical protein